VSVLLNAVRTTYGEKQVEAHMHGTANRVTTLAATASSAAMR